MTSYNTNLKLIKKMVNVDVDEETFDLDLRTCLSKAYNWMNNQLERYTTVPLTGTIPAIVLEIEADLAAGMFKEQRTIPVEGERIKRNLLRERGEDALAEYIKTKYQPSGERRGTFFRHSKDSAYFDIAAEDHDVTEYD